jgi:phage tail sheath gpL-like
MGNIPTGQLVPLFAITFSADASSSGPALLRYKAMLLGQKLTAPADWTGSHAYAVGDLVKPTTANGHWYVCVLAGTSGSSAPTWPTTSKAQVAEGSNKPTWQEFPAPSSDNLVLNKLSSADRAAALYGFGSPLHIMARGYKVNNTVTELASMSVADAAGVAATGTIAFTGPATAVGVVYLYIDGQKVPVAVGGTDSATTVALNCALAINNKYELPVWASVSSGTLTLTAKVKGEIGNDIDIRLNYNEGDSLPAGIGATITAMASGATNPDVSAIFSAIGDAWYQQFIGPYTDASNLTAIETELARRALYNKKIYGQYRTARRGDESSLTTFSSVRNSQWVKCSNANKYPNTPWEFAAADAAQVAPEASKNPAIPMKDLPLYGILPPLETERFDNDENNNLLNAGISTHYVDAGGVVRIQQEVTMYRKSASGADDKSWQLCKVVYINIFQAYDFVTSLALQFPRAILINDGVKVDPTVSIITPKIGRAFAIGRYSQWARMGIVEDESVFQEQVVCQRSSTDRRTLEWLLPVAQSNPFDNADIAIQFKS